MTCIITACALRGNTACRLTCTWRACARWQQQQLMQHLCLQGTISGAAGQSHALSASGRPCRACVSAFCERAADQTGLLHQRVCGSEKKAVTENKNQGSLALVQRQLQWYGVVVSETVWGLECNVMRHTAWEQHFCIIKTQVLRASSRGNVRGKDVASFIGVSSYAACVCLCFVARCVTEIGRKSDQAAFH